MREIHIGLSGHCTDSKLKFNKLLASDYDKNSGKPPRDGNSNYWYSYYSSARVNKASLIRC